MIKDLSNQYVTANIFTPEGGGEFPTIAVFRPSPGRGVLTADQTSVAFAPSLAGRRRPQVRRRH